MTEVRAERCFNAWGKSPVAQAIIREELGDPKARIALIGPAGESGQGQHTICELNFSTEGLE